MVFLPDHLRKDGQERYQRKNEGPQHVDPVAKIGHHENQRDAPGEKAERFRQIGYREMATLEAEDYQKSGVTHKTARHHAQCETQVYLPFLVKAKYGMNQAQEIQGNSYGQDPVHLIGLKLKILSFAQKGWQGKCLSAAPGFGHPPSLLHRTSGPQ